MSPHCRRHPHLPLCRRRRRHRRHRRLHLLLLLPPSLPLPPFLLFVVIPLPLSLFTLTRPFPSSRIDSPFRPPGHEPPLFPLPPFLIPLFLFLFSSSSPFVSFPFKYICSFLAISLFSPVFTLLFLLLSHRFPRSSPLYYLPPCHLSSHPFTHSRSTYVHSHTCAHPSRSIASPSFSFSILSLSFSLSLSRSLSLSLSHETPRGKLLVVVDHRPLPIPTSLASPSPLLRGVTKIM